jgi:large subunit ribosomal protein L13
MAKPSEVQRSWYVIDAEGRPLGRVATEAARLLRGKHKPIFTPHIDTGDHVIIINAAKVVLTGHKLDQKIYYHHSGYPGGLKRTIYRRLMEKRPTFVMEKAVRGMLPKNRLGRAMFKKLKVYQGSEHPHASQKPEIWEAR